MKTKVTMEIEDPRDPSLLKLSDGQYVSLSETQEAFSVNLDYEQLAERRDQALREVLRLTRKLIAQL